MRKLGVMSLRLPDGTAIELGAVPAEPPSTERERKSPAQSAEEARERKHAVLFAASSMRPKLNPVPTAHRR